MSVNYNANVAYSLNQPLTNIFPAPIVSVRAPLATDKAQIGTLWVDKKNNTSWILTSIVSNSATWSSLGGGGGAGIFTDLTASGLVRLALDPATTDYQIIANPTAGTLAIFTENLVSIGSNASAVDISAETDVALSATTGYISLTTLGGVGGYIDLVSGTGPINIGTDAVSKIITIGNTAATTEVLIRSGNNPISLLSNGTLLLESTNNLLLEASTGQLNIEAPLGPLNIDTGGTMSITGTNGMLISTGNGLQLVSSVSGIDIDGSGLITLTSEIANAASPTSSVTQNSRNIACRFTGFTTAPTATQTFTVDSSYITATSTISVTVSNLNASANGAFLGVQGITQGAGSLVIHTINNGAGSLGAGDTVLITVWIQS